MKFTEQDLAWITVAVEDRLELLDESLEWNESQGLFESVEKTRNEIRIYEKILEKLRTRGGDE